MTATTAAITTAITLAAALPALPVKVGRGVPLGWTGYREPVAVTTGDVSVSGHIVVYWLMVSVVVWP
jgi:hypothetical protein